MHNAAKTGASKTSISPFKVVSVVATLILSCFLPYAIDKSLGYPRDFRNEAEQAAVNRQGSASITLLPGPRELNVETEWETFGASAPIKYISFPRDLTGAVQPASFGSHGTAATATVSVESPMNSRGVRALPRSSRTAVVHDLPRRLETNVDRIGFHTPSLAPMAFMRFCMKYPRDCEIRRMAFRPRPVMLDAAKKAELAKINRDVNRAIVPQANNNGVMQEEWLVSPREGDCNDYAVTKRHELLARGWPSRSLLLTEVVISSGEHHLVLIVRTREDDLVLDNLNPSIRVLSQVPYRWVRAQQEKNPKFWSTVNVTRASRVAFNAR